MSIFRFPLWNDSIINEGVTRNKITPFSPIPPFLSDYNARELISLGNTEEISNYTGKDITVAVLDTGIRPDHDVFTDSGQKNWSDRVLAFWDEEKNGLTENPDDIYWHGTWTTSILGGNSSEYQGVAPEVNFIIMNVFEYNEENEIVSDPEIIQRAVDWLIENKKEYNIRIVSMSFGAESNDDNKEEVYELHDMVSDLFTEDMLVVASAGNYGDEGEGTITAPASAKAALAVGGINEEAEIYSKSGRGPTLEGIKKPDVCAPAVSIEGASSAGSKDEYISRSGTSASTPLVAGLAALMLEKDDNLDARQLKNVISLTSIRTTAQQQIKDNIQGWGTVNGIAALSALEDSISVNDNFKLKFRLDQNQMVFCIPLTFTPNQYFLELRSLDTLKAEMFIFDSDPDSWGNPNLIADTISLVSQNSKTQRLSFFTPEEHEYYLVVKILFSSGTEGSFEISLIFDNRILILYFLCGLNLMSLVFIIQKIRKSKK